MSLLNRSDCGDATDTAKSGGLQLWHSEPWEKIRFLSVSNADFGKFVLI